MRPHRVTRLRTTGTLIQDTNPLTGGTAANRQRVSHKVLILYREGAVAICVGGFKFGSEHPPGDPIG